MLRKLLWRLGLRRGPRYLLVDFRDAAGPVTPGRALFSGSFLATCTPRGCRVAVAPFLYHLGDRTPVVEVVVRATGYGPTTIRAGLDISPARWGLAEVRLPEFELTRAGARHGFPPPPDAAIP
jgi:hypothetical protein